MDFVNLDLAPKVEIIFTIISIELKKINKINTFIL